MITEEQFKKWIDVLRSDNYIQGKNYLRIDNKYCPLGVLCDIIDPKRWTIQKEFQVYADQEVYSYGIYCVTVPPAKYLPQFIIDRIILLNDDEALSFKDISDYLEANYKEILDTNE